MKFPFCLILALSLALAAGAPAQEKPSSSDKEEKVTLLDGTSFLGLVEITDDYTLRVKSDSGIQNIPLAQLGQKDFQRYTSGEDRSQDGRLWSERKDALETQKKNESKPSDKAALEIRLAEIAPLQPVIDAYKKTLPVQDKSKTSSTGKEKATDPPFVPLFSQPGLTGALPQPFNGPGTSVVQPAASGGSSVINSAAGAAGLSGVPTVP